MNNLGDPSLATNADGKLVKTSHAICIVITAIYIFRVAIAKSYFFPWYFNTEEFPYIQEVMRFSEFDFRQQFFDIPGTPLMFLSTIFWWVYFVFCKIFGLRGADQGIRLFTFENMQILYYIMRGISCIAYISSGILTYKIVTRILNSAAGLFATCMVLVHPIFATTIYHLRVEPSNLAIVLLSLYLCLLAIDRSSYWMFLASGIFAGVAFALRFPSFMAILPLIVMYCLRFPVVFERSLFRRLNIFFFAALVFILSLGSLAVLLVFCANVKRSWFTDFFMVSTKQPNDELAIGLLREIWLAIGIFLLIILFFSSFKRGRKYLYAKITSNTMTVTGGFALGLVWGLPTLFISKKYFLQSLQMFIQRNQSDIWKTHGITDLFSFYLSGYTKDQFLESHYDLNGIVYSWAHVVLLVVGLVAAATKYRKFMAPIIVVCVIGILSQSGKMQSTRHICAWLPCFCALMASGVAYVYDRLGSNKYIPHILSAVSLIVGVGVGLEKREYCVGSSVAHFAEKTLLMPAMDEWLEKNTKPKEKIFHVCCEPVNEATIFSWLRMNGVSIPDAIKKKSEKHTIWFGDIESLKREGQGYIVISKFTYKGFYLDYYAKVNPKSITDPANDKHFVLRTEIDKGVNAVYQIYYFEFPEADE